MNEVPAILLVCTANVCRSPMAEAALRTRLAGRGLRARTASAGVHALPDRPAHPLSIQAAARAGIADLTNHRSRALSPPMLSDADIVLCMEHAHRDEILARAPGAAGRVHLLGRWHSGEIVDPVNGSFEEFVECLELMNECIEHWLGRLARLGVLR